LHPRVWTTGALPQNLAGVTMRVHSESSLALRHILISKRYMHVYKYIFLCQNIPKSSGYLYLSVHKVMTVLCVQKTHEKLVTLVNIKIHRTSHRTISQAHNSSEFAINYF
jgi:hypothetical protein